MQDIYTIVIMSSSKGSMRQYSVGRWTLRLFYFLFFLIMVSAIGSLGYGLISHTKLKSIQAKNENLNDNIASQRKQLEYLDKEMKEIREMADMVRHVMGIGEQKGVLGQGGDGFGSEEFDESQPTDIKFEPTPVSITGISSAASETQVEQITELKKGLKPLYKYAVDNHEELNQTPSILPILVPRDSRKVTYWYSSGFGPRPDPLTKRRKQHNGLDIATRHGTPIIAAADGVISKIGKDRLLGRMVWIEHKAKQMETIYGHLSKVSDDMRVNKKVKRGEVIGHVGNSGKSTGPHLHYGIHIDKIGWVNPENWILDTR